MSIKWRRAATVLSVFILMFLGVKYFLSPPVAPRGLHEHSILKDLSMRGDLLHEPGGNGVSGLPPGSSSVSARKTILYYNMPPGFHAHNDPTIFKGCNVSACILSDDNKRIENSDAVIFNHASMPSLPPQKKVGQVWIYTSSESPSHTSQTVQRKQWDNKFNWTMSYRRHSDFYFGYGDIIPRKELLDRDYKKVYQQKDKDVAWIVSHCTTMSRREEYVKEMQKYVSIDIYGKCGDKNCEVYKGNENDSCHDVIAHKYKFYLSFENTICKDYTTEKFYFPFTFDKPIVPVARGAFNMKEYVPPDAYIDAADFTSPKDLARYLARIASDEQEYIKLLKQKDKYLSKTSPDTFTDSMCAMCAALHEKRPTKIVNVNDVIFNNQCKDHTEVFMNRDRPILSVGLENIGNILSKLKKNLT